VIGPVFNSPARIIVEKKSKELKKVSIKRERERERANIVPSKRIYALIGHFFSKFTGGRHGIDAFR
jgi:hypothetical protein